MPDSGITATSVVASTSAAVATGVAGATLTAGMILYADATDAGKLKPADANLSAATQTVVGMALHGAASGQPITFVQNDPALVHGITTGAASGDVYYLSITDGAGAITEVFSDVTAGAKVVVIGIINTGGTTMNFRPLHGGVK